MQFLIFAEFDLPVSSKEGGKPVCIPCRIPEFFEKTHIRITLAIC